MAPSGSAAASAGKPVKTLPSPSRPVWARSFPSGTAGNPDAKGVLTHKLLLQEKGQVRRLWGAPLSVGDKGEQPPWAWHKAHPPTGLFSD